MSGLIEWFNTTNGPTTQAIAAAVQAGAALVALGTTIFLLRFTQRQAEAAEISLEHTASAAKAAEATTRIARDTLRLATRPTVGFLLHPPDEPRANQYPEDRVRADQFSIEVVNAGPGAAFDVQVEIVGPLRYRSDGLPVQPFVLLPNSSVCIGFSLDEERPFSDPAKPSWPLTEEDAKRDHQIAEIERALRGAHPSAPARDQLNRENKTKHQRLDEFHQSVAQEINNMSILGTIQAKFRGATNVDGNVQAALIASAELVAENTSSKSVSPPDAAEISEWLDLLRHALRLHGFDIFTDLGTVTISSKSSMAATSLTGSLSS